jgi:parvulin-like peptidyl-prolyl isomerase
MQDAPSPPETPPVASRGTSRSGILVGGTILIMVAAAIGMQVWRAQNSNAAEQSADGTTGRASVDVMSQTVARVNGQAITYEMLANECVERYGQEVLDNVINRTVIQQACAETGKTVTQHEVESEIIQISKKFGLPTDQWYKMLQAERGLTPVQYRRDVIWPMLALKKLAGTNAEITREMMREAYVDNYGPRVKAKMIVLDNLRRAQEIWEKAHANPDDFESLARDYSVESNSRALGGTVPPIRQFSGAHEEIRKTAFHLKEPGEISGIIQVASDQYVILKFIGRTEPVDHSAEDVEAQLHAELQEREVQRLVGETFEQLRENARVDNHLTGQSTGPVEQASATGNTAAAAVTAAN